VRHGPNIRVGDEVTVRIVDAEPHEIDPPAHIRREDIEA
jgi:hypothetical protein